MIRYPEVLHEALGCIDTEKARKLSMTRKECVDRVMQSLKNHEP
jgi:hypothetical protein